jgi:formylglycine-generating enzyme required for sulfatase activity
MAMNTAIKIGDMEFVKIPAGKFLMGSSNKDKQAYAEEKPQHTVEILYDYYIARFLITNAQYEVPWSQSFRSERPRNHPVIGVPWQRAMKYCQRLSEIFKGELSSGLVMRLPTEAEWEKAARGTDGRIYPWGNVFDEKRCNTKVNPWIGEPVGSYSPRGDSPYGCADMSNNAWELTHSLLKPYPYKSNDGREDETINDQHVLRGGGERCAFRETLPLMEMHGSFRVVIAPELR